MLYACGAVLGEVIIVEGPTSPRTMPIAMVTMRKICAYCAPLSRSFGRSQLRYNFKRTADAVFEYFCHFYCQTIN